ncbi:hypothetical protein [Enhydrobacter sp.]|jgi:hypothetical protein|uniref:bestrophin-like domain n=1 Tax=Enhydrobacter sp. TaxID=1894999 RepID=UPI00261DB528|nr:hypothetical protein [Enhydrobacter sp.]WIM10977.1 MAG: hypothetical protein OJF58_001934 [Enhydrobacter sp.]
MSGTFFSTWQIVLSIVTPLAVALLILTLEARGPLAPALQKTTGLVAPYFTAVAILFGLFAALLMSDVWEKDNAARQSVEIEDDSLRAVIQLARVNGVSAALLPRIKAYVAAASGENPYRDGAREKTDAAYEALLAVASHADGLDTTARTALLGALTELRHARDRRLYLADEGTTAIKWLSILILGALTQIAIMLVHIGNRRAIRVSVGLFTVAFTFCLVVVALFDTPFELALAHEPGATLNRTIEGL